MQLSDVPRNQLQDIITQLDQALYNHKEWHRLLIRTLVCRLSCDHHDLAKEAYKECRFGQWYYTYADINLHNHPGFIAIGEEHKRLHALATQLLKVNEAKNAVTTHDYDSFSNSLERLQLEILALKNELEKLVYLRDPLTGALTRLDMLPILRDQLDLVKNEAYKFSCLVMMDLDNFSQINNAYGHVAGDKVLTKIIQHIGKHLRTYDKIFRYGGAEFLLLFGNIELKDAYERVEQIRHGIAHLKIHIGKNRNIHTTSSFGLTLLSPKIPVEESIERADKAVYAAKSAGRNCVKIWNEDQQSRQHY